MILLKWLKFKIEMSAFKVKQNIIKYRKFVTEATQSDNTACFSNEDNFI